MASIGNDLNVRRWLQFADPNPENGAKSDADDARSGCSPLSSKQETPQKSVSDNSRQSVYI